MLDEKWFCNELNFVKFYRDLQCVFGFECKMGQYSLGIGGVSERVFVKEQ